MTSRKEIVSVQHITLTENDPYNRMVELCKSGKYRYDFIYDTFENGIMIKIELYYFLHKRRYVIDSATTFIESSNTDENTNIIHAKKVVCAILLDRLNLGVDDELESEEEPQGNAMDELADMGMSLATNLMRDAMTSLKGHITPQNDEEN